MKQTKAQMQEQLERECKIGVELNNAIRELQAKAADDRAQCSLAVGRLLRVTEEREALCTAIGATMIDIKPEHQAATFARILSEVVRASSGQKRSEA